MIAGGITNGYHKCQFCTQCPAISDTSSLTQSVSMKMLDNALDMNATMSDGITRMMENSVYPNLGGNIDISV